MARCPWPAGGGARRAGGIPRGQSLASNVNLAAAGMVVAILFLGLAYAPLLPPVTRVELQLARKNHAGFWAPLSSTLVTFQGQPYALATIAAPRRRPRAGRTA